MNYELCIESVKLLAQPNVSFMVIDKDLKISTRQSKRQ